MAFPWTDEQKEIFAHYRTTREPLVVIAGPGTGKTKTLEELGKQTPEDHPAIMLAFNNSIRDELKRRFARRIKSNPDFVKGLNQFGYFYLRDRLRVPHYKWNVDGWKYSNIAQAYAEKYFDRNQARAWASGLNRAASIIRVTLTDPFSEDANIWGVLDQYGVTIPDPTQSYDDEFHQRAIAALRASLVIGEAAASDRWDDLRGVAREIEDRSVRNAAETILSTVDVGPRFTSYGWRAKKRTIDFTDQLYLPVIWDLIEPEYLDALVDETQDLNKLQLEAICRSLVPGGRGTFVGDPWQSIYQFNGADSQSVQNIIKLFEAKTLPLSTSFRLPRKHVDHARGLNPDLRAAPGAIEGVLEFDISEDDFVQHLRKIDNERGEALVLARRNAPLVKWAFALLAQRIPVQIKGREFGTQVINIAKKIGLSKDGKKPKKGFDYDKFGDALDGWYASEFRALERRKARDEAYISLNDRRQALQVLWAGSNATDIWGLIDDIEYLFKKRPSSILLSTIHKAKGLECLNVFILEPEFIPLVWKGQSEEQYQQEVHIDYVSRTRSQNTLRYVETEDNDEEIEGW